MAKISQRRSIDDHRFRKRRSSGKPGRLPTTRRAKWGGLHKVHLYKDQRGTFRSLGTTSDPRSGASLPLRCITSSNLRGRSVALIVDVHECGGAVKAASRKRS